MLLFGTIVASAGGGVGLLGGRLGFRCFEHLSETSMHDERVASFGLWKRSVVLGLLTSVVMMMAFFLSDSELHSGLIGLGCLGVSFTVTALYIVGSLTLFTKFGPAMLEAGELSLAVTIMLTALLSVCDLLWITLVVLGTCVLLGLTVLNGIWIYRVR